jgi:mannose-6-phosphate isomerase
MVGICRLRNPIREYAWGSRSAIAALLGKPFPTATPQAELWMGAHPSGSSEVLCGERWISLAELLREDPKGVLGSEAAAYFGGELPFLFKVLAAEQPLSIQAHPDRDQARAGFARENAAGIASDARERCFPDRRAKPELICALTPFWALCGFRTIPAIVDGFRGRQVDELASEISALEGDPSAAGLEVFFTVVLSASRDRIARAISQAAASGPDSETRWMAELAARYPRDPGVLAPLFLNLIEMAPGEAMFLAPGEIHSYLEGVGIEIMANSDNVLRGGLTEKLLNVSELRRVLRFEPRAVTLLKGRDFSPGEHRYESPAEEFELAVLTVAEGMPWQSEVSRGVEILLVIEGEMEIRDCGKGEVIRLERGGSVLIPNSVERYELLGRGVVYRAGVPRKIQSGC